MYIDASVYENIDYYGVTSLYPCNKTGKIPVGHPKIITENVGDLDKYEGLVKCKVLHPKRLYHWILPTKLNEKNYCFTFARYVLRIRVDLNIAIAITKDILLEHGRLTR